MRSFVKSHHPDPRCRCSFWPTLRLVPRSWIWPCVTPLVGARQTPRCLSLRLRRFPSLAPFRRVARDPVSSGRDVLSAAGPGGFPVFAADGCRMTQIGKESIADGEDSSRISETLHKKRASVDNLSLSFRIRTKPVRKHGWSCRLISLSDCVSRGDVSVAQRINRRIRPRHQCACATASGCDV